jgi:hypothetical protein
MHKVRIEDDSRCRSHLLAHSRPSMTSYQVQRTLINEKLPNFALGGGRHEHARVQSPEMSHLSLIDGVSNCFPLRLALYAPHSQF